MLSDDDGNNSITYIMLLLHPSFHSFHVSSGLMTSQCGRLLKVSKGAQEGPQVTLCTTEPHKKRFNRTDEPLINRLSLGPGCCLKEAHAQGLAPSDQIWEQARALQVRSLFQDGA